jgi:hypothetical protein
VDHPCYQCGIPVEDGIPFCKQCGAPQIRVASFEPAIPPVADAVPAAPYAPPSRIVNWPQALPSVAISGFLAAVLMLVPFGALGFGMLAAGFLSVVLYRRRNAIAELTPGAGARLGAATGGMGFAFFGIFTAIEVLVFHSGGELHQALLEAVRQSAARTSDPQAQQMIEYLRSSSGLALVMAMGMAVMLAMFLVFSSLGGALSAYLLRRKSQP